MSPIVFLPGMMCDARLFSPQIANLSSKHSIIVPNLGQQDSMAALADEVLANIPERFDLLGLSMGGILAMEIIRKAPERVEKLALLNTNPLAELEEVKALRSPQIALAEDGRLAEVMKQQMIPKYLPDGIRNQQIEDLCLEMALDLGQKYFVNQSVALRDRIDQQEALKKYPGKTLVLCGAQDRLCPLHRHELLHSLIPHSDLHVLDNTGHLPTLESPEETTHLLINWLK